jgi:cytochrome c1
VSNLPALIAQLQAQPGTPPALLAQLRATHAAAAKAAAAGTAMALPKKVQTVVTNAGGQSPGLSDTLRRAGVKFIDLARRMGLSASALGVT